MEILRKENTIYFLLVLILTSHLFHQPVITNISMGLLGIVSLVSLNMIDRLKANVKTINFWASISFVLIYGLSLAYSSNMNEGLRSFTAKLPLLVFPIMFSMLSVSQHLVDRIAKSFPPILLLSLVVSLGIQYTEANQLNDSSLIYSDNLGSPFGIQAVYNGLFVNIGLILCFYIYSISTRIKERILYILIGVSLFLFHFLLISRIAFLIGIAIIFIGVIGIILNKASRRTQYIVISALIILPILLFLSSQKLQNRFQSIFNTEYRFDNPNPLNHYNAEQREDNWNSMTARLATWACAKEVFLKSPMIGHGIGDHFDQLIIVYKDKNYILGLKEQYNTHNQYIDISLAAGLLGLSALLLYFIFPFIGGIRSKNFLLVSLIALLMLSAFTENILNRSQGIIIIALLLPLYSNSIILQNGKNLD